MMTVSYSFCLASATASRATFTGSPVVRPWEATASPPSDCTPFSGAYTGTPARSPNTAAASLRSDAKSAATNSGVCRILQPVAEFACEGGFTSTLKTGEHDDGRRILRKIQRSVNASAKHGRQLFVDDLHDLLGRIQRLGNLGAERTLADSAGEGTHHVERHVGVEQRAADFADRTIDISLGKLAFALQMLERIRGAEPVKELNAAIMSLSLAVPREISH